MARSGHSDALRLTRISLLASFFCSIQTLLAIYLLVVFLTPQRMFAIDSPAYNAAGIMEHTEYKSDGTIKAVFQFNFAVTIVASNYLIHTTKLTGGTQSEIVDIVTISDGEQNVTIYGPASQNAQATIFDGTFPARDLLAGQVLWFLLASDTYLHSRQFLTGSTSKVIPIRDLDGGFPPSLCKYVIDFPPGGPRTPASLSVYTPDFVHSRGPIIRMLPRPLPPYDQGYLVGSIRVTAQTNLNGLTLPLQFMSSRMDAKTNGTGVDDLSLVTLQKFTVTNIQAQVGENALAVRLPQELQVNDCRFQEELHTDAVYPLTYTVTNGQWLSRTDPFIKRQLDLLRADLLKRGQASGGKPTTSAFAIILVLTAAALPAFFLLRHKGGQKPNDFDQTTET